MRQRRPPGPTSREDVMAAILEGVRP